MDDKYKKITQLLNYFARKNSTNQISKLKALKLIWAADRYHLRKYGRLISDDIYYAMKLGPVASEAKNIAEADEHLSDVILEYASAFLATSKDKMQIKAKDGYDGEFFSKTDLEALEFAWSNFGHHEKFALSTITHIYPEWKKFEDSIISGKKSRDTINVSDFFKDPLPEDIKKIKKDPFKIDEDILEASQELYSDLYAR